jgi:protein tyrosine kinase modulator
MIHSPRQDAGFGWFFNHLPTVIWHRRIYFLTVFAACAIAATVAAFALPTLYRSSATLLIESQQLPTDVAQAPAAGAIEQRIAKIRERVLSRGELIGLIEQYDLYSTERRSKPLSEIIDKMKKATTVGALEGDIGKSNSNSSNVIALNMSFDYPDPTKAQEVLQSFVSSFLKMDSDVVEDQASLTVRFLSDQARKLQTQIQDLDSQITDLKARNGSALVGGRTPSVLDTGSFSAQIVDLENQNRQLALQSHSGTSSPVAAAEAQLAAARAIYSDSHPDVVAAREKLKALRAAASGSDTGSSGIDEQVRANNQAIAQLRSQRDAAIAAATAASASLARGPAILEEASQLENRANALREQYKGVSTDLLKAQTNARMTSEQRGERLSLVEAASLPDHPNWPNRPLLIGAGVLAGLALGLLSTLVVELVRRPLRSPVQIEGMGLPVIGIVPIFPADAQPKKKWRLFTFKRLGRREPELA